MASKKSVPEVLEGFGAVVGTADPSSKESLVAVGARLEEVYEAVSSIGGPAFELVQASIMLLQGVYQEQVSDPAAAMAAVAEGMCVAEACLAQGMGRADAPVAGALAALASAVGGPDAPDDPQSQPACDDALWALNALAAMLIGLGPDDTDDLKGVRKRLSDLAGSGSLPGGCAGAVESAAEGIARLVDGDAADPESILAAAGEAIGQASEILEAHAEQAAETADAGDDSGGGEPPRVEETSQAAASAPAGAPAGDDAQAVLPADTDTELLREYIIESLEHINAAEASLLEMETNPEDPEPVNTVFRAFHTIKGTSGFLGLDHILHLAHLAESLLDRAREGEIRIAGGYADLSLKSCDVLRGMIEGLDGLTAGEAIPVPDTYAPLLADLDDPVAAVAVESDETVLCIGDILVGMGEVERSDVEEAAQSQGDKPIGQVLVENDRTSPTAVVKALRAQKKMAGNAASETSVRVATGRLDMLFDMVGELVIAQSMVAEDPDVSDGENLQLTRSVSHAGKIIRELQSLAMALRMVPLKGTFQKMNRLVRDLGRKGGKSVRFVAEGEDTEIDRNMVEVLSDPLIHMIRNAVDHGIEPPEARTAAGKEPTGTVTLRAYHAAGNVVIELADDGKGLDRERILAKGVERGLVAPGKDLADSEAFQLIFHPGFSTAEKVTDVSGRGVGMDVVRRNIDSLHGRIDVTSTPGAGSKFALRLPLTMAITDAMLLQVGQERYLLPTVSILQSFRPEAGAISTVTGRGEMVLLRGGLIPVFRIHRLFGITGAVTEATDGVLIVLEAEGKRCAVMADELLGKQQVVIKSLGNALGHIPGVAGAAILGDGRVGLILDAVGLLRLAQQDNAAAA